ncbi:MAG: hypothetical protein LBM93_06125 [Oscillospiraceae bacterium]|jgi:hypothetical protein|nr:hypothetical protein [Oscillospiraceae bacterium]
MFNFSYTTTDNTRLRYVDDVTSTDVSLSYHTLKGNNPSKKGDLIAFYPSDSYGVVSTDAIPDAVYKVEGERSDDEQYIANIPRQAADYVFVYVQGSTATELQSTPFANVKATSLLTLLYGQTNGTATDITLAIKSIGKLVEFSYSGIENTTPANVAWVGIWKGKTPALNSPPDFYYVINGDYYGKFGIKGLIQNTDYFIGYFTDGYNADKSQLNTAHLAAYISFNSTFIQENDIEE